ncbi:MAG: Xaa-Pro peptidase family protein [Actinomycetota bacterium]|nr:Xaa-Pro peptidase family protein [Actinomycetota bacterium]
MNQRVDRLLASLEEPLLVTSQVNIRYLTGFDSDNAALLLEPERIRLFTDFRYIEAARVVEGVQLVETARNLLRDLAGRLSGRIGFEAEDVTYAGYETLSEAAVELVPRRRLVEMLRVVKDDGELAAIRRAAEITSEAFHRLPHERFVGRSERDLADWIAAQFRELGGDGPSFPPIVAAGPNAALPHAVPGERVIGEGETVIVDAGSTFGGYCSDCTRTFATGELPAELLRAYEVTREAQATGVDAVSAAKATRAADAAARQVVDGAGLGEAFGHGLGHGVGLVVHELPYLNQESDETLAAGNVVTVEPGVYLPARGGVRIEDLVIVTDDGPDVVTTTTKELVVVR